MKRRINRRICFSLFLVLNLGLLIFLAGCGVENASAPKKELQAIKLRYLPKNKLNLTSCRFFLWRDNLEWQIVSEVKRIGNKLDELDEKIVRTKNRRRELSKKKLELQDKEIAIEKELKPIKKEKSSLEKRRKKSNKELSKSENELQLEMEKPQPDPEVEKQLAQKIAVLQEELVSLDTKIKECEEKIEEARAPIKQQLASLTQELSELDKLYEDSNADFNTNAERLDILVEFYNVGPSKVIFDFQKDGSLYVLIKEWQVTEDRGKEDFTTHPENGEKPTITNVTYEALGGKFTFDVLVYEDKKQTKIKETFSFDIAQVKYEKTDERRQFFSGEMIRKRDRKERKGIANLATLPN